MIVHARKCLASSTKCCVTFSFLVEIVEVVGTQFCMKQQFVCSVPVPVCFQVLVSVFSFFSCDTLVFFIARGTRDHKFCLCKTDSAVLPRVVPVQ